MRFKALGTTIASVCLALATTLAITGCERKEKVLEIETPRGEVEVERTVPADRDVDVDIDTNRTNP
ncbi:MAG: hypothetical protein ACYC0X_16795 [Pirellulaceae bacterium]